LDNVLPVKTAHGLFLTWCTMMVVRLNSLVWVSHTLLAVWILSSFMVVKV